MSETEQNKAEQSNQSDFMIEKIKERPVNKRKLFRRTMITAAMAVMFGLIASVTFLVLEPALSNWLHPEEKPRKVVFPEDLEEMSPEDMLADNLQGESIFGGISDNLSLEEKQIQEIFSGVVLGKENYKQIYSALSDYVGDLSHVMVTVTGVRSNLDWFNNVEESRNQSTGVIIAENGRELLVLADYAPLRNAESLTMTFSFFDDAATAWSKCQVPASLKMQDSATGLAVLSASLSDMPEEIQELDGVKIASLGSSNTKNIVGMPVVALGSPMGLSDSVGYGIITAVSSPNQHSDTNYKMLHTDIYGSQSAGGVLFNLQGQVVGIITNQKSGTDMKNVICAYGISELKKRIEKMSNEAPMAYLGISGMDVTMEAHEKLEVPYGAYVRKVDMNSPSMQAGVQQGDILVAIGDRNIQSYNDYINILLQGNVGSTVDLTLMRAVQGSYRKITISVVLGER